MVSRPQDYNGRPVYSLDGFTRGRIISVGVVKGEIAYANIELDEPNANGETRVKWNWSDCKPA